MFNLKRLKIFALMFLLASGAHAQTLRVGTNAAYAPWEYVNAAGKFEGFEMELAQQLGKKLGFDKVQIVDEDFDSLIPNLKKRRIDVIMSGMDITSERQRQVSFTQAYADSPKSLAAQSGKFQNIDDLDQLKDALKGKVIGAQSGTTMAIWLEDDLGLDVRLYRNFGDIVKDIEAGRIDAGIAEVSNWNTTLKSGDHKLQMFGPVLTAKVSPTFGNGVGAAVAKGNKELLDQLNKAIDGMRQDGTLKQLAVKYFGSDVSL